TLITTGFGGEMFEVTADREVVWRYKVPSDPGLQQGGMGPGGFGGGSRGPGGPPGSGAPDRPRRTIDLLPGPTTFMLRLNEDQNQQVDQLNADASARLEKLMSAEQLETLKASSGQRGPGGPPEVGQVVPRATGEKLKLTADQAKQVAEIQKDADQRLD